MTMLQMCIPGFIGGWSNHPPKTSHSHFASLRFEVFTCSMFGHPTFVLQWQVINSWSVCQGNVEHMSRKIIWGNVCTKLIKPYAFQVSNTSWTELEILKTLLHGLCFLSKAPWAIFWLYSHSTAVKSNALAELMNRASKIHWENLFWL